MSKNMKVAQNILQHNFFIASNIWFFEHTQDN